MAHFTVITSIIEFLNILFPIVGLEHISLRTLD
jgi:hypothetical protein